jgi:hypothetical protein
MDTVPPPYHALSHFANSDVGTSQESVQDHHSCSIDKPAARLSRATECLPPFRLIQATCSSCLLAPASDNASMHTARGRITAFPVAPGGVRVNGTGFVRPTNTREPGFQDQQHVHERHQGPVAGNDGDLDQRVQHLRAAPESEPENGPAPAGFG